MYQFLDQSWVRWTCKIQFVLAAIIYLGLLLMASPPIDKVSLDDGILHFLGNFLFFASAWVAFNRQHSSIKILLLCIPFAILGEFAQYFVTARSVDPYDALANLCGLLLAFIVCSNLKRVFRP